jgi:tripartite-type tricarboxylate transporter receptor subunit TctC
MKLIKPILALLFSAFAVCAQAQSYPSKPISLIIPAAPGGSGDVVGRVIGTKLTEAWGQQILLEHRPGANGSIGYAAARTRAPDGYTLLLGNDSQMVTAPHLFANMRYYDKDFDPVVQGVLIEYVLAVHPSIPANTVPELIAYLKANRGKHSYAHIGIGSIHQLSMEMLKSVGGLSVEDVVGVAYKGSGQYLSDLIGGQIQLAYQGIPQTMPHVRNGKLKAIAIGAAQRLDAAPGVPTIAETYPGFETTSSWNYFAPTGIPRDIVIKLNAEINKILAMPDVRERLIAQGLYPIGGSPEKLAARMRFDYDKWGAMIRKLNLKLD